MTLLQVSKQRVLRHLVKLIAMQHEVSSGQEVENVETIGSRESAHTIQN